MFYSEPEAEQLKKLCWAQAVLCAPGRKLSKRVIEGASHLRLYQLWSSGYDKFDCDFARACGVPVANNGGSNGASVAEHAIMLMLAVHRQLPAMHQRTTTGNWAGNNHGMDLKMLSGKTLGIIGLGNIGKKVAKRALAFDMDVQFTDLEVQDLQASQLSNIRQVSEDELLRTSDILSLHLHLTGATNSLLNRENFKKLKDSVVLINVSRAGLVDQQALLEALESGRLWGAGLDVYPSEPTKAGDPVLNHPRVVATPHTAGSTLEILVKAIDRSIDNLKQVATGQEPNFIVN